MKFIKQFFSCIGCSALLCSCGGDGSETRIELEIDPNRSASVRQIMALDENPMIVQIRVNSGAHQEFLFSDTSTELTVQVTGIQRGDQNDIDVRWIEVLNNFNVEISTQQQSFLAEGDVVIDAAHVHTQFDYDADGVSNFDERIAERCVWTAGDCELDVPGSLLMNGDFSRNNEYWSVITSSDFNDGEVCVTSSRENEFSYGSYLLYTPVLTLRADMRYTVYADIRALTPAAPEIRFENAETFTTIHKRSVQVTSETTTVTTSFISDINREGVLFTIHLGDGTDNRYCIDNVKVVPGSIQ